MVRAFSAPRSSLLQVGSTGRSVPKLIHYTSVPEPKRLPARFYRSNAGREPVREWLKSLEVEDRKVIGEDIKDVEFSWPIGLPLVRSLGKELWEVRSSLPRGRIARIIFCIADHQLLLLHGFIKKTQKIPQNDIEIAIKRKKEGL